MKRFAIAAFLAASALAAPAGAVVVSATNTLDGLVDSSTIFRTVTFAQSGSINDLDVTIHFAKCDGENFNPEGTGCLAQGFSFSREILFRLTQDGGATVDLVLQDTYSGQTPGAELTITLDDEAGTAVGGPLLISGSFIPVGGLSAFDGFDINGDFTLEITDTVFADSLSFYDFTVTADIGPVPAPGALALFGLGIVGVALGRRR